MTFEQAYADVKDFFTSLLEKYQQNSCQCAYPRYRQIMAIDCLDTTGNYSCYETELLIELSKPYFNWSNNNFNINPEWNCKKCGSTYSYEWADFSIYVNRQTVKLINLKTMPLGQPAIKPIPLYLGLSGHAFPPQSEIRKASFEELKDFLDEK